MRDRVAMASGDELRDYRILFRWCIPAVEALSAVHGGIACRPRLREPRLGDDRDAKLATLIHRAESRNQQVGALNLNHGRRETTALPW